MAACFACTLGGLVRLVVVLVDDCELLLLWCPSNWHGNSRVDQEQSAYQDRCINFDMASNAAVDRSLPTSHMLQAASAQARVVRRQIWMRDPGNPPCGKSVMPCDSNRILQL